MKKIWVQFWALSGWAILAACGSSDQAPRVSLFPRVTDATGCILEQITNAPHEEYQFNGVSADGRWLSYATNNGSGSDSDIETVLLDLETGQRRPLPDSMKNSSSFSTDGRLLVRAQAVENGRTEIFEFDLETGEERTIAPHDQWDYLPTYSPDSRHILFNSMREGGQSDIYLYERSSGTLERLTTYDGYDAHAQYTADGTRILFHRMNGEREGGGYDFDLIALDLATREEAQLTDGPFEESYGSWAPDHRHIVFSSDFEESPEKHNLYVLTPEGEILDKLTEGTWKDTPQRWKEASIDEEPTTKSVSIPVGVVVTPPLD